ncbi:Phosducin-like protein 3 [Dissophora globulifera]|uniref:Phosducin-like protein 3 n=1 Tax=Dissophora globulifera TaxID=979702 RepID=A0A9P6RUR0_9FUNG|nr:Phosducin-like protein 3 [Dissophora globulifera]KAG0330040.1 Phosducin-like protein 3 [Dissophora globulifera]
MANNHDEDTEWNDILRAKGIIPKKEGEISEADIIDMIDEVIAKRDAKNYEQKTVDELDELLDEDNEDEERVLQEYRQQRLNAMKQQMSEDKFGEVQHIYKTDFVREVTEASKTVWVVVYLYKDYLPICKLMGAHLATVAAKHKACKFVKIIGDQCIPNYPDRNLPTLLIYGDGDMKTQIVGAAQLGGMNMKPEDIEAYLRRVGALKLPESRSSNTEEIKKSSIRSSAVAALSDDDEYDSDDY